MIMKNDVKWDAVTDVVVLGSGGAALTTAILAHDQGAEVVIFEKSDQIGGTTAFSGGIPWIPNNRYMRELGLEDSHEEAKMYITKLTHGKEPDPELIDVYIENGAKMIDYLHEHTPVRFAVPKGYGDYYANLPGGKKEGRSLDPLPFPLNDLGEWSERIRRNPIFPPLTLEEGGAADPGDIDFTIVATRMENNITTMGRALAGSLFKAVLDRGIQTLTSTPGKELVMNDEGAVIGIRAEKEDGTDIFIGARKGVMIASGGFEWNKELVRSFLKGAITHPQSPSHNEGDGLIMAMEAGAALANMSEAWWSPAFVDPTIEYEGKVYNQIDSQARTMANSILVNKHGKRFVNEGSTYMDLPKSFYTYDQNSQSLPNESGVWMVFDQKLKDRALIVTMAPGENAPDWVAQADSIRELADKIGVEPDQLEATVERFNKHAVHHEDPDFNRGTLHFENFATRFKGREAMIGPIEKGPFYALQVHAGSLGTNGGPRINTHGQVISLRGEVIPGLYAAGNAAMGILGGAYPGAGGTIGPALTFGYLAGMHIGSAPARTISSEEIVLA
ncbi:FAD-dependent oxidoreductase [Saccharococcus sp. Marseille-Q5394]|uniref:FAD-dependent oxidoreductase n=1 Tax=Saccharococcus sp. Marseille-Q5394 TaxID=2972778 RepID=UPI0021C66A31|nr:FAD-dependent oxidoreductase [Saccharococcus sp. Marseille-Q5394]